MAARIGGIVVIGVAMSVSLAHPAQQNGVSITFLANEGVLLSAGGKHVLIDGLFLKYERGYAVPPTPPWPRFSARVRHSIRWTSSS